MSDLQQLDRFEATFHPQREDDLKPGAQDAVGRRLLWEAGWLIEEEDGGPYVGQFACILIPRGESERIPLGWVPDSDLVDLKPVGTK